MFILSQDKSRLFNLDRVSDVKLTQIHDRKWMLQCEGIIAGEYDTKEEAEAAFSKILRCVQHTSL